MAYYKYIIDAIAVYNSSEDVTSDGSGHHVNTVVLFNKHGKACYRLFLSEIETPHVKIMCLLESNTASVMDDKPYYIYNSKGECEMKVTLMGETVEVEVTGPYPRLLSRVSTDENRVYIITARGVFLTRG